MYGLNLIDQSQTWDGVWAHSIWPIRGQGLSVDQSESMVGLIDQSQSMIGLIDQSESMVSLIDQSEFFFEFHHVVQH